MKNFLKIDRAIAKHAIKDQISVEEAQKLFQNRLFEILDIERLVELANYNEKDSFELFKEKYPEVYKKLENSNFLMDISRNMTKGEAFSILDDASKFVFEYVCDSNFTIDDAKETISSLILKAIKAIKLP